MLIHGAETTSTLRHLRLPSFGKDVRVRVLVSRAIGKDRGIAMRSFRGYEIPLRGRMDGCEIGT